MPVPDLRPDQRTRYSRHLLLPEVGLSGQQKICAGRVLVVGAGGLGSPACMYLAAAGIGTLGIADFDAVELHNLQRQILHRTQSVGRAKLDSAIETLEAINPDCKVVAHGEGVTPANALDLFAQYDVIVDGSDNFATRFLNNDAAVLSRRPLVYGGIFKFEGQLSVFAPHLGGPCYRCLFPEPPPPESVPTCGEAGVIGALCGVVGSMQALEALKLIAGFGEPAIGRLITYDALRQAVTSLKLPRDEDCPCCGRNPRIRALSAENYQPTSCSVKEPQSTEAPSELSVEEVDALLRADPTGTLLVDVREPFELQIAQLKGAHHIPMRDVPARLAELPKDKHLLVCCHHGGRSRRVMDYLLSQGYPRVTNVAGGIDAWAVELDPRLQRY